MTTRPSCVPPLHRDIILLHRPINRPLSPLGFHCPGGFFIHLTVVVNWWYTFSSGGVVVDISPCGFRPAGAFFFVLTVFYYLIVTKADCTP
jgi:hypothetical protein